mmetsp:Transcript_1315/g.2048  ORF Transcript_1315/g.2048 Transcript_1315/m.2048 type:complete len:1143 (+) Transcript_1315:61-3489(+)
MNYRSSDMNMPDDEDFNGPGSGNIKAMILSQLIPEEYIYDPLNAEPTLDTLRAAAVQYSGETANSQNNSSGIGADDKLNQETDRALKALLDAAETDVNIHMARIKAVLGQDPKLLETYSKYTDPEIQSRIQRLEEMQQQRKDLNSQTQSILNSLNENIDMNSPSKQKKENLTQAHILERRLTSWERALQMYIYANDNDNNKNNDRNLSIVATSKQLTMIQLLQHLCLTSTTEDEETLTQALSQAAQMTSSHLERTSKLLQDAVEETADSFQSYHIHLIAHSVAAQTALKKTGDVHAKFLHHGKEALKIGHALEVAEAKRRQSEHASVLLRRWWMMENLAEQEDLSGEEIRVQEEVRGVIPSSSCRMDPLFTRKENSLEAAKTLKSLRTIVKCRSSNVKPGSGEGLTDLDAKERFESTNRLILRTSAALEQRLLNTFSEIYTSGGAYDFSSTMAPKRAGRLNWMMLREVSEALMSFDSGRSLHKRYVGLVVSTKFPELFVRKGDESETVGEEDIDGTRSKLSNLFHRVCEVCTEEFQLIAHVFSPTLPPHLQSPSISSSGKKIVSNAALFPETFPLQVARALLQRLISDPENGMQAQINGLLDSIDQRGDFDSGAKKLDTFVVIHEKAAGLFHLLKDAAQNMWKTQGTKTGQEHDSAAAADGAYDANAQSISALIQFLTTQEMSLSNGQRKGYLNLELRLLHHHCCVNLDRNGGKLLRSMRTEDSVRNSVGGSPDYRAPIMPLDQDHIRKAGFAALLNGPLKQSVLRQPLIHATDSLARTRLMFGSGTGGGEGVDSTARVVSTIFSQMCNFYGPSYLYPIIDSLGKMLVTNPPNAPPSLPFDENSPPHNLGVDGNFWITIERIHSAAKSFDRELWAENRTGSVRVWEILVQTRSQTSLTLGKERRIRFFQELEERGEAVILRALDTLSAHIHWILVTGGEAAVRSGHRKEGPYAVPSGSILDSTNSPAVKALTYCLRSQFVHVQAALTPQSLSAFWISLSRRVYDILVSRLLQNYKVSTVGAVVLSRDVEALRSVCMLAGNEHYHWDTLRELLTLYMTPPDSLKTMLVGADGDANSGKGMFGRVGKDQSIVFMSRRVDYRYRTNQGSRKSQWVKELLEELGVNDPTDGRVNIGNYAAENITSA